MHEGMDAKLKQEKLRGNLTNFVKNFREQYTKLSSAEQVRISNLDDYLPPCQIDVLWVDGPEYQIWVVTHFEDRADLEINIRGPFPAYLMINNFEEFLNDPKWKKQLEKGEPYLGAGEGLTHADILEGILINEIDRIKDLKLAKIEKAHMAGGRFLTRTSFVRSVVGNLNDKDYDELTNGIINEAIKAAKEKPAKPSVKPQRVKGYGVYFYPPIMVGEPPKPSFRERLARSYVSALSKKVFDVQFGSSKVTVSRDGFIGVNIKDKSSAIKVLNTIMGAALLEGILTFAARESEISEVEFDPQSFEIVGSRSPLVSLRTMLFQERWPTKHVIFPFERRTVPQEEIKRIIKKAETIFKYPQISEQLILALESYTHLEEAEYAQSFTMSWIIIEKYLSEIWRHFLSQKQIRGKRKEKLANPFLWSLDNVLETLHLVGKINDNEYKSLNYLKGVRNNFVHKGQEVTKEDAEKCFNAGMNIVRAYSARTKS